MHISFKETVLSLCKFRMRFIFSSIKLGLIYPLTLCGLLSCAQSKSIIRDVHGYFIERMPGNIRVGDNGEPMPGNQSAIIYTFYAETSTKNVTWSKAVIQKKQYTITASLKKDKTIEAGLDKNIQEPVFIKAANGGFLWQLDLLPTENAEGVQSTSEKEGVWLIGIFNGKQVEKKIDKLIELYTPPSY